MSVWEALVLGVVQGATEFLPVSSSGHLVMGQTLLDIRVPGVAFEATVHAATLVSILLVYRERVAELAAGIFRGRKEAWRYLGLLALATVPAAAIGLLWRDEVEALFETPVTVGAALLVTGGFLWTTLRALEREEWGDPGTKAAVIMGFAQAFALIPGISRSGSTVVLALWLGVEPREAAAFSFLMAIPALGGAALLQVPDIAAGSGGVAALPLVAGGVAAAVTGILAIRTFVAMLRHRSFHVFAPYCWAVGGLFLAYLALA